MAIRHEGRQWIQPIPCSVSGEHLVGYGSIGKDGVAARGESPACVGPGVKAYKHTIRNGVPATLTSDRECEASQFAGGSKSMQKVKGFRPDLAESLGIPQPLGCRPDFGHPLVVPQSLAFRPELPSLASSSMGRRPAGPEMSLHGVGSPRA